MSQKSKLATFPPDLLDEVERLLDAGVTEKDCADYLNDVIQKSTPELDHLLKNGSVSQQNIHNWKHSGYASRKFAQQIKQGMLKHAEAAERHQHIGAILGWLTAKLAQEVIQLDSDPPPPQEYAKRLHELVADIATIRKIENEDRWINAEERRVAVGENRLTLATTLAVIKEKHGEDEREGQRAAGRELRPILDKMRDTVMKAYEEDDEPDRLKQFGDQLTADQAKKLEEILTPGQLGQLGWEEEDEEEQTNQSPPDNEQSQIQS